MSDDYTPTMARLRREYIEMREAAFGFSDLYAAEWDRAVVAHVAEKRAEWEAELGAEMTGEIRALAFEDGKPHRYDCGLDGCECPDHDDPPRPAGTYITIRLDGSPRIGLWRVAVTRLPVTNTESEKP